MNLFLTIATIYLLCAGTAILYARRKTRHAALFTLAATAQLEMAAVFYVFGIGYAFAPSFGWVIGAAIALLFMAIRAYPGIYAEMNDGVTE